MIEDWDLLEQWRSGQAVAGREFVQRYYPLIKRFFANKVARPDDVLDLTQQTFEACTANRMRVERASIRSYLFGIAMNILRRYITAKSRLQREIDDFTQVCVRDYTDPSISSLIARQRQEILLIAALRELPLEQQIVIELKEIEGLTGREISELLDIREGTVRSRLRLAHESLSHRVAQLAASTAERDETLTDLAKWASQVRSLIDGQRPR